jgi:hypothetical protein
LNSFKVYKSIREIPESEWIHFVPTSRYFLSYQYLSTLEKSSPELDYIYVLYYKNNILKGLVSFQVVDFKGDALRKYIPDTNFLVKFILNKGLDCIQSKLLVLGNLIFTCETGWYFDPLFSEPHRDKMLFEMIRIARKQVPKNTIGIMINEASGIRQHHSYKCQGFHLFEVENKMVFKSRLFSNFSEYDEKLISKYRVRKNKIFQLNKNIEFFEINVLNFEMYQNEIQDLFNNVIEQSKFKLLDLNKDYFKIFLDGKSTLTEQIQEHKESMEKFKNIRYIHLEKDPGLYEAWNIGIKESSGEYLSNANLDDRKSLAYYSILISELMNSNAQIISSLFWTCSKLPEIDIKDLPIVWYKEAKSNISYFDFFKIENGLILDQCLVGAFPIWSRNLHNIYGYFDEQKNGPSADYEFWLRAISNGCEGIFYKVPLGYYLKDPNSYARRIDTKNFNNKIINKYLHSYGNLI